MLMNSRVVFIFGFDRLPHRGGNRHLGAETVTCLIGLYVLMN